MLLVNYSQAFNFFKCKIIFIFLDDILKHLTDHHAHELGFYCQRDSTKNESKAETLETDTKIIPLQKQKSITVKLFIEQNKEKLSTPDHLPPRTLSQGSEEVIQLDENSSEVNENLSEEFENSNKNREKSSVPVITEVIHIDSY